MSEKAKTARQISADTRRVTTPVATLSFANIWEPAPTGPLVDGVPPVLKYSGAFVFAPGTDLSELHAAAMFAATEKWGDRAREMFRIGDLRTPFRDDAERKGYAVGSVYINARSKNAPGVVSRYEDPDNPGRPAVITDHSEIYSGAQVKAIVQAYWYDKAGNRGVSFGLDHIQKVGDGARLDNRTSAEDAFEFDLTEPAAQVDLSDMTGFPGMGSSSE